MNKDVEKITEYCENNRNICSCYIIGSVAKKMNSQNSDLDILILHNEKYSLDDFFCVFKEAYQYDNIIKIQNVSVYLTTETSFIEDINSISNAEQLESVIKPWVVGGEIREVLLSDIVNSIPLIEKNDRIKKIILRLSNDYPDQISTFAYKKLLSALIEKIVLTLGYYKKRKVVLGDIGYYEAVVLLSRIYCIEKRIYNPGFKHLLNDYYGFVKEYRVPSCYSFRKVVWLKHIKKTINNKIERAGIKNNE